MNLIEHLANTLDEWPEYCVYIFQDEDNFIYTDDFLTVGQGPKSLMDDWATACVTKPQWLAAKSVRAIPAAYPAVVSGERAIAYDRRKNEFIFLRSHGAAVKGLDIRDTVTFYAYAYGGGPRTFVSSILGTMDEQLDSDYKERTNMIESFYRVFPSLRPEQGPEAETPAYPPKANNAHPYPQMLKWLAEGKKMEVRNPANGRWYEFRKPYLIDATYYGLLDGSITGWSFRVRKPRLVIGGQDDLTPAIQPDAEFGQVGDKAWVIHDILEPAVQVVVDSVGAGSVVPVLNGDQMKVELSTRHWEILMRNGVIFHEQKDAEAARLALLKQLSNVSY